MPSSSYFSIGDIFATQTRVQCKFNVDVLRLGQQLDPSSESENVYTGSKLEIPLWLAQTLCQKKIVTAEVPAPYKEAQRDILQADANVVDLHKLGPHFYDAGLHLLSCKHQESDQIGDVIVQTLKNRFRRVMDFSKNSFNNLTNNPTLKLDESERRIFDVGLQSQRDFEQWENGKAGKLCTSSMVSNHKKRKRTESLT